MLSNNIEKHRKRCSFFKVCYFSNVPLRANLASLQGRRQTLNSLLPQRRARPKDPIWYDTLRFVLFTFLTKQALCRDRISTLTESDMGRQKGAWRNIGKTAYEIRSCFESKKNNKSKSKHSVHTNATPTPTPARAPVHVKQGKRLCRRPTLTLPGRSGPSLRLRLTYPGGFPWNGRYTV